MPPALAVQAHELQSVVSKSEDALLTLLPILRKQCEHSRVIETDYVAQTFLPSLKPRRLCLDCGIEEEGWGAGYHVLIAEPTEFCEVREDFYQQRPFPGHSEEWGWCYGGGGHALPRVQIGHHHRCTEHE